MKAGALAAVVAAWFLGHTWKGLFVYFQGDDMHNLYGAWITPWWKLLLANLIPFTSVYRPLGALVYRTVFAAAGWNPLAYRVLVYALLLANIWLVYRVVQLVAGSAEIAFLSAFLFSYHHRLIDLYINNGAIYDVLCATFFLLALESYLRSRPVLFLIFYILALNSKEMAAALPLILLAWDWIHTRRYGTPALWIAAALTAIAFFTKTSTASAFAGIPDYAVHVSLRQFLSTTRPELANLFLLRGSINTLETVLIFAAVWALALWLRSKPMLFAAAFLTLAPLPINFIAYRGFFVMYIPFAGWALFFAALLIEARDRFFSRERIGVFALLAYFLWNVYSADPYGSFERVDPEQGYLRSLHSALVRYPAPPKGGRILLLNDPFAPDSYNPLIAARLTYRDESLSLDRKPANPPYDLTINMQ